MSQPENKNIIEDSKLTLVQSLIVSLFGLPMIAPLLKWSSVPCTHDGHLHYYRIAALRYAWESGIPFSRWLPDLVFGYGYPFLIYREAPPLYLPLIPHLLGIPLPAAINLFYAIGILASGWFMFLWVKDIFGARSGLISAIAYMAAPYLLIDAFVRGNQPEAMAMALFPLILWSSRRYVQQGSIKYFLITTPALTLLALSHNISILIFLPFLLSYLLAVAWMKGVARKPAATRLILVIVLGLGMAAFYLAPALLELDEIAISQSVSNRNNDFHFNFATVEEILAPVKAADPTLLNPPLLIRLGWIPAIFGLMGIISAIWNRSRERRGHILFMGGWLIIYLFMSLSASLPFWEGLPLIEYVQFPWRFIGRASLPLAFLAGVPFALLPSRIRIVDRLLPFAPLVTAAAATLLVLESIPYHYPSYCSEKLHPTINDVHAYERESGLVGVDPTGSYFPKTVQIRPTGSALEQDYQEGRLPQRFDHSSLPDSATIESTTNRPLSGQMIVDSPVNFQGRFLALDFPGWQAMVDGQEVPITPSNPEGLITIEVPAGRHTVEVAWRMTPMRALMSAVSLLSFAVFIGAAVLMFARYRPSSETGAAEPADSVGDMAPGTNQGVEDEPSFAPAGGRLSRTALIILVAVGVMILLLKVLLLDRSDNPFREPQNPPVSYPSGIVAGELRLEGFTLGSNSVAAGDTFEVDLAWRTVEKPSADYQSNLWLLGQEGMIWSDKETYRPRTFEEAVPSRYWLPGQWAWDSREIEVLDGTPPGLYDIELILFNQETLQPLTLVDKDGSVIGPSVIIGSVEVLLPEGSQEINPQFEINEEIGGLTLLGYNQDREEADPGEVLLLTLFWELNPDQLPQTRSFELALIDESGTPAQRWAIWPVSEDFQPQEWPEGIAIRGQHSLRLAPDLLPGIYRFQLEDLDLGLLSINRVDRLFDPPAYEIPVEANFDDLIELSGVSFGALPTATRPFTWTLTWKGLAKMPISYHVFVHLVDEQGTIIAQSDGVPAGWNRPTTGWLPGEYIVDTHVLSFPGEPAPDQPHRYLARVGLYDPATGIRLTTGGQEFVQIKIDPAVEQVD